MTMIVKKLFKELRCPHCKAKVTNTFEVNIEDEYIGWNFDCPPYCVNSWQRAETGDTDGALFYTNLNGKFIEL